jgi:sulfate transport system permease protein
MPAVILATLFVTVPYVAKQILPQLNAQSRQLEEAALTLGADGLAIFRRITLPSIKLSLVQGVILAAARAAGEFGAVSMVSGHIRGLTTTLPQHVEILYNEYRFTASYAVASILALFALLSLAVKAFFININTADSSSSSSGRTGAIS